MLCGGPTDKPGRRLPVSPTCELKATHRHTKSWNLTLIDETGCFQQKYIKASNRAFTVQTRYTHTGTGRRGHRCGVNKGNDRGEMGRGQLASALSRCYTCHTCSLHDETQLEYRPHFVLTICQAVCLLHSPSQITADYNHTQYRRRHTTRYILFLIRQCSEWILGLCL